MGFLMVLAIVLFTAGAIMNNECKTNRQLWWCAPTRPHISGVVRSKQQPARRVGTEAAPNS
jgi:hypothetical protein